MFIFAQETDIFDLKQRLSECFKYYQDGSLKYDCEYVKCLVPTKCMQFNAVYHILHFLADNAYNVSFIYLDSSLYLTNALIKLIFMFFFIDSSLFLKDRNHLIDTLLLCIGNECFNFIDAFLANGQKYKNTAVLL